MVNITNVVDALGSINEEIRALETAARKLKAELFAQGVGQYAGTMYVADVQHYDSAVLRGTAVGAHVREYVAPDVLKLVTATQSTNRVVVKSLDNTI